MEDIHVTKMAGLAPEADNVALLTDFDPNAEPGSGVPDPWYGSASGFDETLRAHRGRHARHARTGPRTAVVSA